MKKVFLCAYDRKNLGDDLFIHTITKRYPYVRFYIWTDKANRDTFRSLPNLTVVDSDSRFVRFLNWLRPSLSVRYYYWLIRRCEAMVYIGGSIFIEYPNWEMICNGWEYKAENFPFYVLGANFGPWHSEGYRDRMNRIFGKMQDVCFRDRYSHALFKDNEKVRSAPDILYAYPMPQTAVDEKQVFVSVIDCASRDDSHGLRSNDQPYVDRMAALLQQYLQAGHTLVLSSFCKAEGDEQGVQRLLAAMGCENEPRIRVLHYDGTNADQITEAIAESGLVIATRFHATILALAAGRPVLPIIYSDKTRYVLEDLGFNGAMYDIRRDGVWEMTEGAVLDVEQTKIHAQAHFEKLDEIL
jgi:colanic acid/amylovoran biosynthesis protein